MHSRPWTRKRRSLIRRSAFTVCLTLLLGAGPVAAEKPAGLLGDHFAGPNEDWRARGIAFFDFPRRIRARVDSSYDVHSTTSDRLASAFLGEAGPSMASAREIETRIALSRPLFGRVEVEIAWQSRARLAMRGPFELRGQIVGAFIRFSP